MMSRIIAPLLFLCCLSFSAGAQADLFGSTKEPSRKGFVIGINGNFDMPGADMARRFGNSYRIGPSLSYKTTSNWMFGVKTDFIFGNRVREDSLLYNVSDKYGQFINNGGQRIGVGVFERGYLIGVQAGKILPLNKAQPHKGILIQSGAGFVQHKISIIDEDKTIGQVRGDYRKGYDRLTNGWYLEQFVGWNMFDRKGLINFHIGLDLLAGFTAGRRDFLYDVMRKDDASRVDLLFGIRGGLYIPIFNKKSEEVYFE